MAAIRYTLALLAATVVYGQTSSSQAFHLTTVPSAPALREIGTILRTVAGIEQVHLDEAKSDITVIGTDAEREAAAWIVKQLDTTSPRPAEYTYPGGSETIRILYLTNTPSQRGLNEVITALRVVSNVQRIFTYSPGHEIVLRSNIEKAALAVWTAQQLDVSPDDESRLRAHDYAIPGEPGQAAKVIYLTHPGQPADLNELVTILRTVADIQAIFTRSEPQGMAFRGSLSNVQLATLIVEQLDNASFKPAEYAYPGGKEAIRILYLENTPSQQGLNEVITALRAVANVQRIFTCTRLHGIVLRATTEKAALAVWMALQLDVAPDDKNRWRAHDYAIPGDPEQVAKVSFLAHPGAQSDLNEMVTILRTVADVPAIFTRSEPQAIAFRGSLSNTQLGDWLFQQLDVAPDAQLRGQLHEYSIPGMDDGIARVYFLNTSDLNDVVVALRSEVKARMFVSTRARALAVRGTREVMAVADRVVKQMDKPAAP
jgi:hypothetical protein